MEYVEKLNKIGLKWSVHERRPAGSSPEPVPSMVISGSGASSAGPPSPSPSDPTSTGNQSSDDTSKAQENAEVEAVDAQDEEGKELPEPAVSSDTATNNLSEVKEDTVNEQRSSNPIASEKDSS